MTEARLVRVDSGDQGTFGGLYVRGRSWFSGELPWRDNAPQVSCIPTGTYEVVWAWSPHLRRFTYRLASVPGRAGILIHPANLMGDVALGFRSQLYGCIALGLRLGHMARQKAILVSAPAVRDFEDTMMRVPFTLEVTWQ